MRDQKEILLQSRKYADERRIESWWHLGSTVAICALLAAIICLFDSWLIRVPCGITLGLALVRVFIIYHDFEHGSILAGAPLAKVVLKLYGLLVLNPPSIWKRSHDHHHRNNAKIYGASIGSYPVMTREVYARSTRPQRLAYLATRHPMTIALGYMTVFLWGMCLRSFWSSPRQHLDSAVSIVLHVGLLVGLGIFDWRIMLTLVVLPMTVAASLGAYLFYAQHNFPTVKLRSRGDWDYLFAALRSSSYIRMGPVMQWFTGNIGFHHVHHLNARIPFYRLPEAMAAIAELQSPGTTSLSPADVWRCFRLKLWDPDLDRMVPVRGAA